MNFIRREFIDPSETQGMVYILAEKQIFVLVRKE